MMIIKHITIESAFELLNLCHNGSVTNYAYIRQLFENNFTYFEDNAEFLKLLDLIEYTQETISLKTIQPVTRQLIISTFCEKIKHFPSIESFLCDFVVENDCLSFSPSLSEIVRFADERRMLMSFGLLKIEDGCCRIRDASLAAMLISKPLSLESFKKQIQKQELAGEAAERFVMNYELAAYDKYADVIPRSAINHIAPYNVNAGYDIESFSKEAADHGKFQKIFIEVKCVSFKDYRFFWSKNEIQVAKKYNEQYYLYLIDKSAAYTKDFENGGIEIICNPYKNVYCNSNWIQDYTTISFRRGNNESVR